MTKEFFERGKQIAKWADNNMTKNEALKDLLEIVEHAIKVNDWKVDGACDPEIIINRAKEALEQPNLTYEDGFAHGYEAHRAEQALEQPAQEPVAYTVTSKLGHHCGFRSTTVKKGDKVYTCPQEPVLLNVKTHDDKTYKVEVSAPSWQGLSDDERFIIVQNADWNNPYDIAELIEQALKEKNNVM